MGLQVAVSQSTGLVGIQSCFEQETLTYRGQCRPLPMEFVVDRGLLTQFDGNKECFWFLYVLVSLTLKRKCELSECNSVVNFLRSFTKARAKVFLGPELAEFIEERSAGFSTLPAACVVAGCRSKTGEYDMRFFFLHERYEHPESTQTMYDMHFSKQERLFRVPRPHCVLRGGGREWGRHEVLRQFCEAA